MFGIKVQVQIVLVAMKKLGLVIHMLVMVNLIHIL